MKKLLTVLLTLVMAVCLVNLNNSHTKAEDNAEPVDNVELLNSTQFSAIIDYVVSSDKSTVKHIVFCAQKPAEIEESSYIVSTDGNARTGFANGSGEGILYIYGSKKYTFNADSETILAGFTNLIDIDFGNIDASQITNSTQMFALDSSLKRILVNGEFNLANTGVTSTEMFLGCTALIGGNGTAFDSNKVDATYAKVDKEGQAGYFTDKENGPIYCDGITYSSTNGWKNGSVSLTDDELASFGIEFDPTTKTVSLSKSIFSDSATIPTLRFENIENVIVLKSIKVTASNSNRMALTFGNNVQTPVTIYGNGNTLTLRADEARALYFSGADSSKVLAFNNINIVAKSSDNSNPSVAISKGVFKNKASLIAINDQAESQFVVALSSTEGIGGDDISVLGSTNSEGTGKLLVPETGHGIGAQAAYYKVNVGTTEVPDWKNVRYIQILSISKPTPTPDPGKKDESCEKVIGPTWHWNNDKGICEDYGVVGTSTR